MDYFIAKEEIYRDNSVRIFKIITSQKVLYFFSSDTVIFSVKDITTLFFLLNEMELARELEIPDEAYVKINREILNQYLEKTPNKVLYQRAIEFNDKFTKQALVVTTDDEICFCYYNESGNYAEVFFTLQGYKICIESEDIELFYSYNDVDIDGVVNYLEWWYSRC